MSPRGGNVGWYTVLERKKIEKKKRKGGKCKENEKEEDKG
jgi:hypothetical protein